MTSPRIVHASFGALLASVAALGCSSSSAEPGGGGESRGTDRSPSGAPTKSVSSGTAVYICPMCEGVRQNGPGRCPRCGMNLVREQPSTSPSAPTTTTPTPPAPTPPAPSAPTAPTAHADHDPRHGGQLGMQGDVHVELVARPDGLHRVYLSDALRVPIAPGSATDASLRFAPSSGGAAVESPLRADAALGALVATTALPTSGGDVTVRVNVANERIAMDFSLDVATGGGASPGHDHSAHPHRRR